MLCKLLSYEQAFDYLKTIKGYYYTYILHRESGKPFYVGKGKQFRAIRHLTGASDKKLYRFIRRCMDNGETLYVSIYHVCSYDWEAKLHEASLIEKYGLKKLGGLLLNEIKGTSFLIDSAGSFRVKHVTKPRCRNRISNKRLHAKRISMALKGRVISDEVRARMSLGQRGKTISEEQRKAISYARRNSPACLAANLSRAKPIEIDGVAYKSISEASRKLHIDKATIHYRLKHCPEYVRI